MKALPKLRAKVVQLRMQGLTYPEILEQVPVAQSSVSLWCRNLKLTSKQQNKINVVRRNGIQRGAKSRHENSINLKQGIILKASEEISSITDRELWLIGIALYWAEGSKKTKNDITPGVRFTNSDPYMIKLFDLWLTKIIKIDPLNIDYEIYLHESMLSEKTRVISFWSKILAKPKEKFDRIYLKKSIITKNYHKSDYQGVVRIVVKKSTNLNCQISGWQQGITKTAGW